MIKKLFAAIAMFCMSTSLYAASIKVDGEVVRGTNKSFIATVSLKDITTTELGTLTDQQFFESRVYVILESYDGLKVPFGTSVDDALAVYKGLVKHDIDGVDHDIVAQIEIRSNKTLDIFKDSSGDIYIGACIRRVESSQVTTTCDEDVENQKVQILNIVVNDAPTDFKATARHLQTSLTWNVKANPIFINELDEPVTNRTATGLYAVLVKTGEGVGSLAALEYLGGPREDDTPATCIFDENVADGASCLDCGSAKAYLDIEAIKKSADYKDGSVKIADLSADAKEATFVKLDEDHRYIGFVTYAPDAIKRSTCYSVTPYKGLSWTELNGGDEAKTGNPCFVATAAYGTDMAAEIDHLRWFRDEYLMPYAYGRLAVKAYYKYGPGWATYIAETEKRRAAVRIALWPVVKSITYLRSWKTDKTKDYANKKK